MSKERVKKFRAKNLELGRKRREFYLTDKENTEVKAKVERLRAK